MPVLSVRISEKEKRLLAQKAKEAGVSAGVMVREFINERPFTTGADLLEAMTAELGNKRLGVRRRK